MTRLALLAAAALAPSLALGQAVSAPYPSGGPAFPPFPTGRTETINVIQWDANAIPVYQRSEQLPLTDEEVARLSKAGFSPQQIAKMIEERRCACDASADGLIRLKEQGVAPEVLSALSLHALPPNRFLNLTLVLDFAGKGLPATGEKGGPSAGAGVPRDQYLYVFLDDGAVTRVYSADLGEMLRRRFSHEALLDRSDLLLTREVRRVTLPGQIPLKTYGKHTLFVTTAARPTIVHPSDLTAEEKARGQSFTFDYPRASLQSVCSLHAGFKRDPVLAHKFTFAGSRFECEWN